jgi:hypothetical protein
MHAIRPSYLTAIRLIAVQYLEKATKSGALHCAIYIPQSSGILSLGSDILLSAVFSSNLNQNPSVGIANQLSHPHKLTYKMTMLLF